MRTTVVLDDALLQEATKAVLETWLAKNEPPPRRWKTLVIEQGLSALLADENLGRTLRDTPLSTPKNLTIIVDEALLRRAEAVVAREFGSAGERTRMASAVINHGLRALLRQRASRRLAAIGGEKTQPMSPDNLVRGDAMVSADAGVWLAYFENAPSAVPLRVLLQTERVSVHPFVVLELRLRLRGPERNRRLMDLERLVACPSDSPEVVSAFVEEHELSAFEIDLVGATLITSAARQGDQLWTNGRELREAASQLKVMFSPLERPHGG